MVPRAKSLTSDMKPKDCWGGPPGGPENETIFLFLFTSSRKKSGLGSSVFFFQGWGLALAAHLVCVPVCIDDVFYMSKCT